jgi:hypothetical protein
VIGFRKYFFSKELLRKRKNEASRKCQNYHLRFNNPIILNFKYWWPVPLFLFIFKSQIGIETSTSVFCLGVAWWFCGVDEKWSGGLFVLDLH